MENMSCHKILAWCPGTSSPGHFAGSAYGSRRRVFGAEGGAGPPHLHLSAIFFIYLHLTTGLNLSRCPSSLKLQFLLLTALIISPLPAYENRKSCAV